MKNLPEKIWLYLGFDASADDDFKECDEVTWNKDDTTGNGIEYVRSDIAKEFALQFSKQAIDAKVDIYVGSRKDFSINELFTEFINSRKAQK